MSSEAVLEVWDGQVVNTVAFSIHLSPVHSSYPKHVGFGGCGYSVLESMVTRNQTFNSCDMLAQCFYTLSCTGLLVQLMDHSAIAVFKPHGPDRMTSPEGREWKCLLKTRLGAVWSGVWTGARLALCWNMSLISCTIKQHRHKNMCLQLMYSTGEHTHTHTHTHTYRSTRAYI